MKFKHLTALIFSIVFMAFTWSSSILAQSLGADATIASQYEEVINYCLNSINRSGNPSPNGNYPDKTDHRQILYYLSKQNANNLCYWLGDLTGDNQEELVLSVSGENIYGNGTIGDAKPYYVFTISNGNLKILNSWYPWATGGSAFGITTDKLLAEDFIGFSERYIKYSDFNGNFVLGAKGETNNLSDFDYPERYTYYYIDNNFNRLANKPDLSYSQYMEIVNNHPLMNIAQSKVINFKGNISPDPSEIEPNAVPIYRLYNERTGEHLYTSKLGEANILNRGDWKYESVGWNAPTSGDPVYRLYNPALDDHLYTSNMEEMNELTERHGWKKDNNGEPLFYSGGDVPVYRLYNPRTSRHHLTKDEGEYNILPSFDWRQENKALSCIR